MLSLLTLDNNKKVTNWTLTRVLPEKSKPCDTNFEPTMNNLANGRVILKISNSFLMQKNKFLVLGEEPADGINDSTDAAKKTFGINFSKANTKFFLSLHYNDDDSSFFS